MRRPRVFLFDEPLSNLDAALRVQVRAELKKLHERLGATFVYVTHDQAEAMTLADRIVVLRDGVARAARPPREIYDRPASAFVARFFGDAADEPRRARDARPRRAAPVLAGVRPEDLSVVARRRRAGGLEATVWLVEPMGAETWVTVERGGARLVARCARDFDAPPGATVRLSFDPARLHRFDAASGRRLE